MRLHLSHRILLLLITPLLLASAIIFYEFQSLRTIYEKVHIIETIDDINLNFLELRRYEKNILLFNEEENVRQFNDHLDKLKTNIRHMEPEIVSNISRAQFKTLQKNIDQYERDARNIIASMKQEQRIIEEIRPLGRTMERSATDRNTVLDLRRYEKNYIIYKEQVAIHKVHSIASDLMRKQPSLSGPVTQYLQVFERLVRNEMSKDSSSRNIRFFARDIQKITSDLLLKKREDIDTIIKQAKQSFVISFIFLLVATMYVGGIISTRILKTIRSVNRAVKSMARGDFTYILDPSAPEEIVAFNRSFNCTVQKLEEAKVELELTMEKLEATNRELLDKQEELVETRKMTAMRLLAAEIAHEVSNPLSSVITSLGMLREDLQNDSRKREDVTFMLNEAIRCQAVLRELVDFARKEPLQLREVNIARLVHDAVKSAVKQHNGKHIALTMSLEDLPARATIDPVLVYQALYNIITNAYQHTHEGGAIEVRGSTNTSTMHINIRDTGMGIPEDILPYIFDPFFSTRKDTGGNGLGLAISKKIIERHNGTIQVASTPGVETLFQITIPVQAGAA